MPRPRKPTPSFSPTALTWSRWRPVSAQVWCRFSSGAPDSSSWPAGSRLIAPSAPPSAMTCPPSSIGSQPNWRSSSEDIADSAGLVVGRARHGRRACRRASRARCRCASARAASRPPASAPRAARAARSAVPPHRTPCACSWLRPLGELRGSRASAKLFLSEHFGPDQSPTVPIHSAVAAMAAVSPRRMRGRA